MSQLWRPKWRNSEHLFDHIWETFSQLEYALYCFDCSLLVSLWSFLPVFLRPPSHTLDVKRCSKSAFWSLGLKPLSWTLDLLLDVLAKASDSKPNTKFAMKNVAQTCLLHFGLVSARKSQEYNSIQYYTQYTTQYNTQYNSQYNTQYMFFGLRIE